jgi:hypothetical protein
MMEKHKPEFDGPWKDILDIYFEHFIAYCWPSKYHEIDWNKGYTMLDKELTKVTRQSETGQKVADKLVQIYLKNGDPACIFLHIEVERSSKSSLPERMFTYNTRLRDFFKKSIASLAILLDSNKNWRPNIYTEELWSTTVEIRFPIIKILDYQDKIPELEASNNPFAAVILAQLAVMKKENPVTKLRTKISLSKRLYAKGWKKQDLLTLFKFIDWIIALPPELELEYNETIEKIEEEFKMTYVSTAERVGIRKGEALGIEKGKVIGEGEMLVSQLTIKFQTVPQKYLDRIKNAHTDALMVWAKKLLFAPKIEDVFEEENTPVAS